MKKLVALLLMAVIVFASVSAGAYGNVVTMYAPDGRQMNVYSYEVQAYRNVGWYTYPVMYVYNSYGTPCLINSAELSYYENMGWEAPVYNKNGLTIVAYNAEWYHNDYGQLTSDITTKFLIINNTGLMICFRPLEARVNTVKVRTDSSVNVPNGASTFATIVLPEYNVKSAGEYYPWKIEYDLVMFDWDYYFVDGGTISYLD